MAVIVHEFRGMTTIGSKVGVFVLTFLLPPRREPELGVRIEHPSVLEKSEPMPGSGKQVVPNHPIGQMQATRELGRPVKSCDYLFLEC